uniref:nectin-4 isoform X5 n=1 Tax=Ictidomys tridecemlineatus TaxID=43179 RepID=UPI001AA00C54|nr:nectin-4 isoform X5 [Ictidomys tridecemlineatus]
MPLSLGAEMWGPEGWLLLLFLASFTGQCPAGVLETTDLITVVLGQDAKLPCFYRGNPEEKVEQVAWARMDVNEGAQELALLNSQYGLHTSSAYKGRVEQPPPPRDPLDGSVLLRNAVQADEGEYECRVSTFPSGSFQARLRLRVLVLAEASVRGLEDQKLWHVGREGAMLKCLSEGQPPPSYNWTRLDGPLPSGVRAEGNTLGFPPLTTEHSGTYVCHVSNELSSRDSQVTVNILADPQDPGQHVDLVSASVVVVGVIAALLFCLLVVVVILMSRYHRRKAQQMTQKYEEELTLTRENSIRRLHSHHTDPRSQPEESVGLRAEGHPDSLKDNSSCSVMSEEPEGRSYSTLTTVREIETQTELLSPGSGRAEEEEDRDEGIKQAMNHFVQENGTLRAKPTGNGIYINGRGHLV